MGIPVAPNVTLGVDVRSSVARSPAAPRVRALLARISGLTRSGAREVSVLFCGDRRMRTLNHRYRGKDRSTDVLAFPSSSRDLLGDIAISVPYASREARRRGHSFSSEVDRLLLHGFLHLLGYDHETDHGEMEALEAKLAGRLGVRGAP